MAGRPLVEWSLAALRATPEVAAIVVACPPTQAPGRGRTSLGVAEEGATAPEGEGVWEGVRVVDGGATRADSVANALAVVETELVAIHDAARPLLTPDLVSGVVAALRADPEADAAIAASPVTDTIKRATAVAKLKGSGQRGPLNPSGSVAETVDRGELWQAQTPQVFRAAALRAAIEAGALSPAEATDEAMLIEAAGGKVLLCPAPAENLKVTTPLDLRVAELLLRER